MASHNIIVNLAKLGLKTSVIGVYGSDSVGKIAVESLKDLKVDTSNISIINDLTTRCFHINKLEDGLLQKKGALYVIKNTGMMIVR